MNPLFKLNLFLLYFIVLIVAPFSVAWSSPLQNDERVLFIPNIIREVDEHTVEADIQAWAYEPERRPGLTSALARYLRIDLNELSAERRDTFYQRTQLFRVDSKRGKDIKIRLPDGSIHSLPATGVDGRTHRRLRVARTLLDQENRLHFSAVGRSGSLPRQEQGSAWLVSTHGLSIVSDIDDTIKDSQVLDRKTLLRNTFLNDFKPVAGMATWYSRLRAHDQNVTFHYLSSSPIQLHPLLRDFLEKWEFPGGTIHLRESTSWRTVIATSNASQAHKRGVLMKLLTDFPERRFILIGDSGEADPEIYAEFARSHPKQISAIFIRDITGENAQSHRYQKTFSGISNEIWHVFREAPSF